MQRTNHTKVFWDKSMQRPKLEVKYKDEFSDLSDMSFQSCFAYSQLTLWWKNNEKGNEILVWWNRIQTDE